MTAYQFKVGDRVTYNHCDGPLPAEVFAVSLDGSKLRLKIAASGSNRAWQGLHWIEARKVTR